VIVRFTIQVIVYYEIQVRYHYCLIVLLCRVSHPPDFLDPVPGSLLGRLGMTCSLLRTTGVPIAAVLRKLTSIMPIRLRDFQQLNVKAPYSRWSIVSPFSGRKRYATPCNNLAVLPLLSGYYSTILSTRASYAWAFPPWKFSLSATNLIAATVLSCGTATRCVDLDFRFALLWRLLSSAPIFRMGQFK
jgi:hypothetical protein